MASKSTGCLPRYEGETDDENKLEQEEDLEHEEAKPKPKRARTSSETGDQPAKRQQAKRQQAKRQHAEKGGPAPASNMLASKGPGRKESTKKGPNSVRIQKPSAAAKKILNDGEGSQAENDTRCANCWRGLNAGRGRATNFHPFRRCMRAYSANCLYTKAIHATTEQMPEEVGDLHDLERKMEAARLKMIAANCISEDATHYWYDAKHPIEATQKAYDLAMELLKEREDKKTKEKTPVKPQAQVDSADTAGSQDDDVEPAIEPAVEPAVEPAAAKPDDDENQVSSDTTTLLQQLVKGVKENNAILKTIADNGAEGNNLMRQLLENTKRNGEPDRK
ncbi:hypothetical protein PG985_016344 [Apiospora marii]|uniref:uncharacterized protein n=1 Tax=Apiospora marii TaxID=335849 RepID=UPI00312F166D